MAGHRYRRQYLGTASLQLVCSCGWRTSVVRRWDSDIAYSQWQGHVDLERFARKLDAPPE